MNIMHILIYIVKKYIDQLFLTLIKLRCAKEDIELSLLFQISESTVSRIFNTWVNFLHSQLNDLNIWPSRQVVDECMPSDFHKKFPTTRLFWMRQKCLYRNQKELIYKASHGRLTNTIILLRQWFGVLLEEQFLLFLIVMVDQ
jgi:hypothetical protein